jgi:hypothetical protein
MADSPDSNQELRLHPEWWARNESETCDLEALAGALGERSPVKVRELDGRYYMKMAEFDQINESGDVETALSRQWLQIRDASALAAPRFPAVSRDKSALAGLSQWAGQGSNLPANQDFLQPWGHRWGHATRTGGRI